jgi:hypothetical protein
MSAPEPKPSLSKGGAAHVRLRDKKSKHFGIEMVERKPTPYMPWLRQAEGKNLLTCYYYLSRPALHIIEKEGNSPNSWSGELIA